MLRSLDISKSPGEDKISGKFLRDAAEGISSPLTYIINLSLKSATAPDDFKLARVLPIYKKGNRNYEGNYRPVSILPVASKVLEKIVYNQMHNKFRTEQSDLCFPIGVSLCSFNWHCVDFSSREIESKQGRRSVYRDGIHRSPNKDEGLYTGMAFIDLQTRTKVCIPGWHS